MEVENGALKVELQKLRAIQDNSVSDKRKYMEGAVWMGRRMTNEVEKVCQSFELLDQEYLRRFKDFERNNQMVTLAPTSGTGTGGMMKHELEVMQLQRAQVWFLEAVKKSGFDLYERVITMLEGALHHKTEAESRLDDAYTPVRKGIGGDHTVSQQTDMVESLPVPPH
jgi:hypothetical protein